MNGLMQLYDNLEIKITKGSKELKQVRKLRLNEFSNDLQLQKTKGKKSQQSIIKKQIERTERLMIDGYDRHAEHLIISTLKPSKVIAYARIIDSYTAFKLGGYFCSSHFNIDYLQCTNNNLIEISRISFDPEYQNQLTIRALWSGITSYAKNKNINAIMGVFPVPLKDSINNAEKKIKQLKSKFPSTKSVQVDPYQLLPPTKKLSKKLRFDLAMAGYFFELGPKLCGDAYWNKDFNQAELFFHYPLSANQQNIINCSDIVA